MSLTRIKDYSATHPSQRRVRHRPRIASLLGRYWRSLARGHDDVAVIPLSFSERSLPPPQAPAVTAPVPVTVTAAGIPVSTPQANASVPPSNGKPTPKDRPCKSASIELQSEILDNPREQRLQLLLQAKPDRTKVQQAIAGAMTELILKNMGIRLKGTVKARQKREDALYQNVGLRTEHPAEKGDVTRPSTPPSQPKNPGEGECQ